MTPPSMETLFLILSGAILVAGVVYWLWSHIQLTQKKVQLLENAVFELRAMIPPGGGTAGPPPPSIPVTVPSPAVSVAGAAEKPYADLSDDDWDETPAMDVPAVSTPLEEVPTPVQEAPAQELPTLITREAEMNDSDLMPGGRISLGVEETVEEAEEAPAKEDAFKQIFANPRPALEGMPLKELRRLGEQRGLVGAAEMRKKELLAALRHQVTSPVAAPVSEPEPVATKELDLDAVEAEEAEILE
jgi:hypothetical protein